MFQRLFSAKRKGLFFLQKSDEGQATLHHCVAMPSRTDGIQSRGRGGESMDDFHIFYTAPRNNEHNFSTYSDCFDPDTWI